MFIKRKFERMMGRIASGYSDLDLETLKKNKEWNDSNCWTKRDEEHWIFHKKFISELEKLKEEKYEADSQIGKGLQISIDIYSCRFSLVTVKDRLSGNNVTLTLLKELDYSYIKRNQIEQELFNEDKYYAETLGKQRNIRNVKNENKAKKKKKKTKNKRK